MHHTHVAAVSVLEIFIPKCGGNDSLLVWKCSASGNVLCTVDFLFGKKEP